MLLLFPLQQNGSFLGFESDLAEVDPARLGKSVEGAIEIPRQDWV